MRSGGNFSTNDDMKTELQYSTNVYSERSNQPDAKPMLPAVPLSDVYLEDCVKALKRYADNHFDLAIVDPPYGIEIAEWDKERPTDEYWEQLFRVSKNQIVWGGNYMAEHLGNTKCIIIWDKMTYIPTMSQYEFAFCSFNKHPKMVKINSTDIDRMHPTQKPIKLYDWLLHHYAKEGDLILDTHLGSGSSRISAYKGGFNFVGFEIDQEYYEKQEKRFNDFKSQLRLF